MSLATIAVLGVLAVLGVGAVALVGRFPLASVVGFLLAIAFVPIWVIVPTPITSPSFASSLAGLLALGLLSRTRDFRWTFGDLLVLFVLVAALGPVAFGVVPVATALNVLIIWCTAYVAGRLVLLHVDAGLLYAILGVIFGLVGLLALVEFLTGWHGLSSWGPSNGARVTWGTIQERAGLARAEGAFGHSIALGSSLAMAAVLTLQARLPRAARLVLVALMAGGTAVTLSRGSLACLALGLALALALVPEQRIRSLRPLAAVSGLVGLVVVSPLLLEVFTAAGTEASGSAAYRGDLLSLLGVIEPVGRSSAIDVTPEGNIYINGFRSIDNQLLVFGLNFGWLMIGVLALLLAVGVVALISGRGTAPGAAMVAQVPALVSVALITQYAVFFWFVLGLALGAAQLRGEPLRGARRRPEPGHQPLRLRDPFDVTAAPAPMFRADVGARRPRRAPIRPSSPAGEDL